MKERFVDLPFFIFGHSMGGLIALKAVLKNKNFFRCEKYFQNPWYIFKFKHFKKLRRDEILCFKYLIFSKGHSYLKRAQICKFLKFRSLMKNFTFESSILILHLPFWKNFVQVWKKSFNHFLLLKKNLLAQNGKSNGSLKKLFSLMLF